jgi:N6-L-threonylcarbamoyladenine synthase
MTAMITLGIETSCDETSCAILKGRDELLSNLISSSLFRHKPFGGVVPEIASRHCLEQIDVVYKEALDQAKIKSSQIGLIAVTEGPGLIGSLLVGISFAKALSYSLKKPLIGVNHLDAHLTANFIGNKEPEKYIGLLVSGGHTSISYHDRGKVKLLGSTVDDAVGEAYDKTAKMMGLGYPGGPVMDKLAQKGNAAAFPFTKPKQKNRFDFSYSGIKTAVLYKVQAEKQPLEQTFIENMAASFQKAAVGWLVEKTLDAAQYKKVRHIVVGGGVSANSALRARLTEEGARQGIQVAFPPFLLTMDNAGMIARRGYELFKKGRRSNLHLSGNANLRMGATLTK